MMQFSVKIVEYQQKAMLNICDANLVGKNISQNGLQMSIESDYYGTDEVDEKEAERLLRNSNIINMVGKGIVSLSTGIGVGSPDGVKTIGGVPFLIVFQM